MKLCTAHIFILEYISKPHICIHNYLYAAQFIFPLACNFQHQIIRYNRVDYYSYLIATQLEIFARTKDIGTRAINVKLRTTREII